MYIQKSVFLITIFCLALISLPCPLPPCSLCWAEQGQAGQQAEEGVLIKQSGRGHVKLKPGMKLEWKATGNGSRAEQPPAATSAAKNTPAKKPAASAPVFSPLPGTKERLFKVPKHGFVSLSAPADWGYEVSGPEKGLAPSIRFTGPPGHEAEFSVHVTALWSEKSEKGFNSAPRVRAIMQSASQDFLAQAVEKAIQLQELKGRAATGSYFTFTYKDTKPGEWRTLTQGGLGVGNLLLTFSVFSNSPEVPEIQRALEMMARAAQTK